MIKDMLTKGLSDLNIPKKQLQMNLRTTWDFDHKGLIGQFLYLISNSSGDFDIGTYMKQIKL